MLKNMFHNAAIRKFIKKNLITYLLTNTLFNSLLPYLTLKDINNVQLFEGQYCFARFLLPMALFIPFVITFDVLKKTITLSENTANGITIPDGFTGTKMLLKKAGINGFASLAIVSCTLLCLQLLVAKKHGYNGSSLCLLLGILAGIMSVVFTLLPIRWLTRHIAPDTIKESVH